MRLNSKISAAVAAILSAPAATVIFAAPADLTADQPTATTAAAPANELKEVIVTANRREQNLQDVPITVQALTADTLSKLNVSTLDDFVKYLPSVSTGSMGPGQSTLFMRGLSVGVLGTQGQGSVGGFPNVAVYLDEQSGQLPGRNLDVYAADLERVEVLEGPQGTLFGAGAEAGVIRYITNKPKLNVTDGSVTAGYGTTAHGGNNSNITAVLNLPLVDDRLAVRFVVYNDQRGGYIDNVPSTFTRAGTDLGLAKYNGGVVPTNSQVINNYNLVQNDINPLTYQGLRASVLFKFNDNWDALLVQSYQNMNAQGVFYQMPNGSEGTVLSPLGAPSGGQPLPPLSVTLFNPSYTKDRFENTALTVTGKIGDVKLVYAGSYLDRNIEQAQDYTNYARGVFGYYYQCAGYSKNPATGQCYTPSSVWTDTERNTHLSQELRLSTPDEWRLRGLVGLFYEDEKVYDDTEWLYKSVPDCSPSGLNNNCFLPIQPWPGPANRPGIRNESTGFFDDFQRGYDQTAAFTSIDYDILPKVLTVTAGTRWYDIHNKTRGGDVGSFYCKAFAPTTYYGVCGQNPVAGAFGSGAPYGTNLNLQNPNSLTATGFRSRANISWHVTPDALLYYTWSQGYRPGGFNRGSSNHLPDANGIKEYATPSFYVSDSLTNSELGWKTMWFDRRIQFNGAVYQEDWTNAQVGFFCPQCGLGNLTYGTNGPDYRVRGVELQLVARVMEGFTIQGSASWNSTQQTNSPSLIGDIPGTPGFGKPVTQSCAGPYPSVNCTPLVNVYGPEGSVLANSPPFQANLRGRYEWAIGEYQAFAQFGFVHQAHSLSATGNVEAYDQPGWTTYDGSIGIGKDAWEVELVGQNLTDVNESLFTSSRQFIITETPMRPRVLGVQFSYKFEGAAK
ncbi:MAG TPA: TonB-dependent receptor [Steroidobacteraceae bacterium]|nr:TonB-dependent receptor [Steroidobacteraceae bacterium]